MKSKDVITLGVLSDTDKKGFEAIKRRLSRCPPWCFCNTKVIVKQEYTPSASTEAREMHHVKYQQVRRFSLEPFCPLINHLCPPFDYNPKNLFSPSTSLYMVTIEDTRFLEVIHELE